MASFGSTQLTALSICLISLLLLSKTQLSFSQNNTDIHELLPQFGLPRGLFPANVESYSLSPSDGSFEIKLKAPCYVAFVDLVYYDRNIKGKLSYGSAHELSGVKIKKLFVWLAVTEIEVSKRDDGAIYLSVGSLSEVWPAKMFEKVPTCKTKAGRLSPNLESM